MVDSQCSQLAVLAGMPGQQVAYLSRCLWSSSITKRLKMHLVEPAGRLAVMSLFGHCFICFVAPLGEKRDWNE